MRVHVRGESGRGTNEFDRSSSYEYEYQVPGTGTSFTHTGILYKVTLPHWNFTIQVISQRSPFTGAAGKRLPSPYKYKYAVSFGALRCADQGNPCELQGTNDV